MIGVTGNGLGGPSGEFIGEFFPVVFQRIAQGGIIGQTEVAPAFFERRFVFPEPAQMRFRATSKERSQPFGEIALHQFHIWFFLQRQIKCREAFSLAEPGLGALKEAPGPIGNRRDVSSSVTSAGTSIIDDNKSRSG